MCVCVCVCVRVCVCSVVSDCRGKEVEKGRLTARKLDCKKEVGEGRQVSPCWQRIWYPQLRSLSVIIVLGLKKRKVLIVFPSVPLRDQRVVLNWNWGKEMLVVLFLQFFTEFHSSQGLYFEYISWGNQKT